MKVLSSFNPVNYTQKTNPSFSGKVSVFSKKMDKILQSTNVSQSENLNLLSLLKKNMVKQIKKKAFLGEGCKAIVLSLDSKYVLKLQKNEPINLEVMNIPFDKFRDLNFKSYFGGVVAKFGNVSVLKNVSKSGKHLPAGVPASFAENNLQKACVDYYENIYLPRFASLPQKSFDDVAYDFKLLNKNSGDGYCFDVRNPNNFVLVGKKIKIVDCICKSFEEKMTTTDLLTPFLFFQDVSNECLFSTKALNNRRKLFKKIILAGIKNDLPLVNGGNSFVFEEVLESLCKAKVNSNCFIKDLNLLKSRASNKNELLGLTKQYLNSIFDVKNQDFFSCCFR